MRRKPQKPRYDRGCTMREFLAVLRRHDDWRFGEFGEAIVRGIPGHQCPWIAYVAATGFRPNRIGRFSKDFIFHAADNATPYLAAKYRPLRRALLRACRLTEPKG